MDSLRTNVEKLVILFFQSNLNGSKRPALQFTLHKKGLESFKCNKKTNDSNYFCADSAVWALINCHRSPGMNGRQAAFFLSVTKLLTTQVPLSMSRVRLSISSSDLKRVSWPCNGRRAESGGPSALWFHRLRERSPEAPCVMKTHRRARTRETSPRAPKRDQAYDTPLISQHFHYSLFRLHC